MKASYKSRPSRQEILQLPVFDGLRRSQVLVLSCQNDVRNAQRIVEGLDCVGFDTETKPVFEPNQKSDGPHLIQFAHNDGAILCPATYLPGLDFARSLICSEDILKVGFGLKSDRGPVKKLLGCPLRMTRELAIAVQGLGYRQQMGMRVAVAVVLGRRLQKSKKVQMSNWAAKRLTDRQVLYAANDAYASLKVHQALVAAITST